MYRRPFWLPAPNYYFLAAAVAIGFFFLVWGILNDGGEESPWITAGLVASSVMIGAVILREIILRNARIRFLREQRRLDMTLKSVAITGKNVPANKLTLEKNAAIISEIRRKSDAAKVLGKLAESHREVFELCSEYIAVAESELPGVGAGSPRIAALHKGRDFAGEIHRYHMLQWAQIEARSHARNSSDLTKPAEKLNAASKALGVVDLALNHYPAEESLIESRKVLHDLVVSIKVTNLIDKAERASFKGSDSRAAKYYQDALFVLRREGSDGLEELNAHIAAEIERIRQLSTSAESEIE